MRKYRFVPIQSMGIGESILFHYTDKLGTNFTNIHVLILWQICFYWAHSYWGNEEIRAATWTVRESKSGQCQLETRKKDFLKCS